MIHLASRDQYGTRKQVKVYRKLAQSGKRQMLVQEARQTVSRDIVKEVSSQRLREQQAQKLTL